MDQSSRSWESGRSGGCPSWCIADHGSQQDAEDRWHESEVLLVPVVELRGVLSDGAFRYFTIAETFEIRLEQRVEQTEAYVLFGIGTERERNFRLSVESTSRLIDALNVRLRRT